jgi:hypothetical protein
MDKGHERGPFRYLEKSRVESRVSSMSSTFIYPPPVDGKPFRLNMGLRSLEPQFWLESGEDLKQQIPERIELATTKTAITNLKPVTHPSIIVTDCYYKRLLLLHTMTSRLRLW